MMDDIKKLQDQIEYLRQEMSDTALKQGLTNKQTITLSQELDLLITHYQRFLIKHKRIQ